MISLLALCVALLCGVGLVMIARKYLFALLLLTALPLCGQSNCDKIVYDQAGMLGNRVNDVLLAADKLVQQGAEVRIVTLTNAGGNLDKAEQGIVKQCSSWQGTNGVRKSTMVELMVSKEDRKFGIYYGASFHNAFDNHWNRIKQDYMLPRLKSGDTAGAFIATEEQLASRLSASKDEAIKPQVTQNQVVNQASDLSGLWKVLGYIFGGIFLLGLCVWIVSLFGKKQQSKEATTTAQQNAANERNRAATGLKELEDAIEDLTAAGQPVSALAKSCLQIASDDFTQLSKTVNSPDTEGLTKSNYDVMQSSYARVNAKINQGKMALKGVSASNISNETSESSDESKPSAPSNNSASSLQSLQSLGSMPTRVEHHHHYHERETYPVAPVFTPTPNLIVIDNETPRYETPQYTEPVRESIREPEADSGGSSSWSSSSSSDSSSSDSSSSDSSSSDSGGGSSSWSSSDSSSSSWDSGGGSSSSFDSGSSDSGGGGSDSY